MKLKIEYLLLFLIFASVLAVRLYFSFQTPFFDKSAYFNIRQVEYIQQHGIPLFNDPLSFGGRFLVFEPFFHYLLTGFAFIMPLSLAAKILPNLFAALMVIIVYLIAQRMTKHTVSSLYAALLCGYLPIFFGNIVEVSELSFFLPVMLLAYYFLSFERIDYKIYLVLILMLILVLTSTLSIVVVLGLLIFVVLLKIEKMNAQKYEMEIILFFLMLVFWVNALLYKNALLVHGFQLIWQNVPTQIMDNFFTQITFPEIFYYVGFLPLILGLHGLYLALKHRNRVSFPFIGLMVVVFIMLWFRLLPLKTGLIFFGVLLALISALSVQYIIETFMKTKFSQYWGVAVAISVSLIALFSIAPSLYLSANLENLPTQTEMDTLQWMKNNTLESGIVLADIGEGHLLNYVANRKSFIDDNFLGVDNINARYEDMDFLFKSRFETEAIRKLKTYEIDYIYLSESAAKKYNQTDIFYAQPPCFELVYNTTDNNATEKIYLFLCG
jgi:hypothetical protein